MCQKESNETYLTEITTTFVNRAIVLVSALCVSMISLTKILIHVDQTYQLILNKMHHHENK
jgi:hypothetical protein